MTRKEPRISDDDVLALLGGLWAVDHGLQAVSKRMRANLGITGPQRIVLRFLGRQDGISAGELARLVHDHPSTLTGVLRRLEDQGLLTRETDPKDRRRVRLRLTDAGRELDAVREGTAEAAVRVAIGRLARSQVVACHEVLRVIAEELEKIVGDVDEEPDGS